MAKPMKKDMKVINQRIRESVQAGQEVDSPLVQREIDPSVISKLEEDRRQKWDNKGPNGAYQALLDRYRTKKGLNLVENTIDEVISEEIYEIRQAVNNMIDYGDYRVFKMLPEELDNHIKAYGLSIQEYYGQRKSSIVGQPVFVVPASFSYCTKCMKFKDKESFYFTNSDTCNGVSHICKECANELFKNYMKEYKDIKEVLILISHKLDLYVYQPVLQKYVDYYKEPDGKNDIRSGSFLGKYIGDLGIQIHFNPGFEDFKFEDSNFEGVPFKCIVNYAAVPQIYEDKFVVEVEKPALDDLDKEILDDEKELSQYMIRKMEYKWGKYPPNELKWLERRYREWEDAYDITALNTQKLIIQMCCDELVIVRLREQGADVSKQWKSFMETMKNGALTPRQQAKDAKSSGFSSLSEFIKEVEKGKPFINKDPQFEDVDGVKRFIVGVAGAISRTLGKRNEYSDAFDEIYADYTSSLLSVESGDDDGEE